VVNPAAGKGRFEQQRERWQSRIRTVLPQARFITTRPEGGLANAIEAAQAEGLGGVLAVGGDGTAHQVVNALLQVKERTGEDILLALLPLGTGNDWIRTHGIPRRWRAWRAMFLRGHIRWQNLGLLHYQTLQGKAAQCYFLNVAGLAYDAFVVREVAQANGRGGKLLYLWATLRSLFKYTPQAARLTWPNAEASARYYTINLGIGRYSGGGMQLVPQANPQGEKMALTFVERISRLRVLLNSWRFYRGWVAGLKEAQLTEAAEVTIEGVDNNDPILLEADGEFLGQTPVRVTLVARGLWFVA